MQKGTEEEGGERNGQGSRGQKLRTDREREKMKRNRKRERKKECYFCHNEALQWNLFSRQEKSYW